MRAIFAANEDAKIGDRGTLNVEFRPRGAASILASCDYVIVELPPPKGAPSSFNLPQINIQPINSQEDGEWDERNFGEDVNAVAMVHECQGKKICLRFDIQPYFRGMNLCAASSCLAVN